MTIWDHLTELRKRLFVALIALAVTTILSFMFTQRMIEILAQPVGGLENLQSIEITENVSVFMRVSLLAGVIMAMPIIVYELLMFILPGLTPAEKKWIYLAVPSATILFVCGVAFTYYVMLPAAVPFLLNNVLIGITTKPRVSNYINFISNMMFWIGVSFESPLLVFVLAKFNIVKAQMLAKQWRIAVVVIALIAAMVTPTVDPVNMGLLMLPLFTLYLISILLAYIAQIGNKKKELEETSS